MLISKTSFIHNKTILKIKTQGSESQCQENGKWNHEIKTHDHYSESYMKEWFCNLVTMTSLYSMPHNLLPSNYRHKIFTLLYNNSPKLKTISVAVFFIQFPTKLSTHVILVFIFSLMEVTVSPTHIVIFPWNSLYQWFCQCSLSKWSLVESY